MDNIIEEYDLEQLIFIKDNLSNIFSDINLTAEYWDKLEPELGGSIMSEIKYWYIIKSRDEKLNILLKNKN